MKNKTERILEHNIVLDKGEWLWSKGERKEWEDVILG